MGTVDNALAVDPSLCRIKANLKKWVSCRLPGRLAFMLGTGILFSYYGEFFLNPVYTQDFMGNIE